MPERVYVDYNTMSRDLRNEEDKFNRVMIAKSEVSEKFRPGERVLLYDETLEVEATLEFDEKTGIWWARPNWDTRVHLPYPRSS